MLTLTLSPLDVQVLVNWARLDRRLSGGEDPALQDLAGRAEQALRAWDARVAALPIAPPAEPLTFAAAAVRSGACLTPGCKRRPEMRGVCGCCYGPLWRSVKAGLTTWEQLIADGKVLACTREPAA